LVKLSICRLQYGISQFYPEVDYDETFKLWILNDVMNFRYWENDYNSSVQLTMSNFTSLYLFIYFDIRANNDNVTNDPKKTVLHYRLNKVASAQNYTIYA